MKPKSKMFAFAMAGTVAAASAVMMRGPEKIPHDHDLPVKVHMAELVIGATHGLTEIGWENPAIEARVAVLEAASEPYRDDALRETGRQQALSGSWGDAIIEGYLAVLDTPGGDILKSTDYAALRKEYAAFRETQTAGEAARTMMNSRGGTPPYEVQVVTGRIKDVARVWEAVKARVGEEAPDAEVAAHAMESLGYGNGPIAFVEPEPWIRESLGRHLLLGQLSAPAGHAHERGRPIQVDFITAPGQPV